MAWRLLLFLFPAWIVYLLIDQYVVCPTYVFDTPKPFHGPYFQNPYAEFSEQDWALSNMHAHTASWLGLTNGKGQEKELHDAYDSMGYDIHLISDYQYINPYGSRSASYIPAYEHGINIPKAHQLVLGSSKVTWKDYIFPQTLSNRQALIDRMAGDSVAIVINHPAMRIGYQETDMKFLQRYHALEVLNAYEIAFRYWDTALSNGHMVSIVGNDDTHNAGNRLSIGRFATLIHAPNRSRHEVIRSIKEGRTIGVQIPKRADMSFSEKISMLRNARTQCSRLWLDAAQLKAVFANKVNDLTITGQGGQILWKAESADSIAYDIRPEDSYLRISYTTSDGIRYHFNPVYRVEHPSRKDDHMPVTDPEALEE